MKKITSILVLILFSHTLNAQINHYDVNGDNYVNMTDVTYIINRILGKENPGDNTQAFLTCPDNHHPHMIDLGLPSGTKWACCNVGAIMPEDYGNYYAFGETEVKDVYDRDSYLFAEKDDNYEYEYYDPDYPEGEPPPIIGYYPGYFMLSLGDIKGTQFDVAHQKWGGPWIMPDENHIWELLGNCKLEWIKVNNIKCARFTGKNGGQVIFPTSGFRCKNEIKDLGNYTICWSGDGFGGFGYALVVSESENINYYYRFAMGPDDFSWSDCIGAYYGIPVRPVIMGDQPAAIENDGCPDENHPHMIDLGLPSGTKWACCDLGADKPGEEGDLYAWGETETKDMYEWENYIHCDGTAGTCHNIGNQISGTTYDVAYVKSGGSWQMPTEEQLNELCSYCKMNVRFSKFIGPNGNAISSLRDCWTDRIDDDEITSALLFYTDLYYGRYRIHYEPEYRCSGHPIRPVCK